MTYRMGNEYATQEATLVDGVHDEPYLGERLVHKASQFLDDSAIINSMRQKDGRVLIDMFVHQEGDCRAGPTKRVKNLYAYEGPDRRGEVEESPYQRVYADGARALQGIYGTPIPSQVRETFNRTVHDHRNCSAAGNMGCVR